MCQLVRFCRGKICFCHKSYTTNFDGQTLYCRSCSFEGDQCVICWFSEQKKRKQDPSSDAENSARILEDCVSCLWYKKQHVCRKTFWNCLVEYLMFECDHLNICYKTAAIFPVSLSSWGDLKMIYSEVKAPPHYLELNHWLFTRI